MAYDDVLPPQYPPIPSRFSPPEIVHRHRTDYKQLFIDCGSPVERFTVDRFGYCILPNSRGVFLKVCLASLPPFSHGVTRGEKKRKEKEKEKRKGKGQKGKGEKGKKKTACCASYDSWYFVVLMSMDWNEVMRMD